MQWFFRLPLPALFAIVVGGFVVGTLAGMMLVAPFRARVTSRFARSPEQAAYFGTQIWLVYSLILSLVAVGGWSEYQGASERVSREVATMEVLRDYAHAVATQEWLEQRAGRHPSAAKGQFARLNLLLGDFEPTNLPDRMVHAETLREPTTASEARRSRIHATASSLPSVVWLVVIVGAGLALTGATFFVTVDDKAMHMALVGIMAAFVGLVVFVTVALDHPFQGAVTPSENGFLLIAERPFGGQ